MVVVQLKGKDDGRTGKFSRADGTAGAKLDKAVPLFVQNEDEVAVMKRSGFKDVQMFMDNGVALRIASAALIVAGIVGLKLAAK